MVFLFQSYKLHIQQMGCLCPHGIEIKKRLLSYEREVVRVNAIEEMRSTKLQFSTQKLKQISGDLLVLFADQVSHINQNEHFLKMEAVGNKIQEYVQAALIKRKAQGQGATLPEFMTFDIKISNLKFQKASIIYCQPWMKENPNDQKLKQILRKYLESEQVASCKQMVITQFPSILGIHLQKGARRILREVVVMPTKPQRITFCNFSSQSNAVYLKQAKENQQNLRKSMNFVDQEEESHYY